MALSPAAGLPGQKATLTGFRALLLSADLGVGFEMRLDVDREVGGDSTPGSEARSTVDFWSSRTTQGVESHRKP